MLTPQCPVEEIDLIPHPMDAWRAALNALIACAPGDGPAIAVHLAEARQHALMTVDRSHATPGVAKIVDHLMLLGAGRIVGERLANPTTSASLTRRVTNRLTVVVNGNDYDVSAMPDVMVGDMLRIDPNNLPPLLNLDAVPGAHFQRQVDAVLQAATRSDGKCLFTRERAVERLLRAASGTATSSVPGAARSHLDTSPVLPARSAQPLSANPQSPTEPALAAPAAVPASDLQPPETGHSPTHPAPLPCAPAPQAAPQNPDRP